jgi:hypothetical protein
MIFHFFHLIYFKPVTCSNNLRVIFFTHNKRTVKNKKKIDFEITIKKMKNHSWPMILKFGIRC